MIEITAPIDIVKVLRNNNLLIEEHTVDSDFIQIEIVDTKNCTHVDYVEEVVRRANETFNYGLGRTILYNIKDNVSGLMIQAKVLESNGKVKLNLDNYLCLDISFLNRYYTEESRLDYNILLIPKDIKIIVSSHEVDNGFLIKHKDIDGVTYEERCNLSILYDSQVYKCTKETFDWHFGENNQWDGLFGLSWPSRTEVYNPYAGFKLMKNKKGTQLEFDFTKNINKQ